MINGALTQKVASYFPYMMAGHESNRKAKVTHLWFVALPSKATLVKTKTKDVNNDFSRGCWSPVKRMAFLLCCETFFTLLNKDVESSGL